MEASECAEGNCVDGVCCDTACAGECQACSAEKTGGVAGTCAAVAVGTDPDTECTASDPNACGVAGTGCNGDAAAPACQLYQATAPCGTACVATTGGKFGQTFQQCDGLGTCGATGTPSSCGYSQCTADGSECRTACATDGECTADAFCNKLGNPTGVCHRNLHVALEAKAGSCAITEGYAAVKPKLEARGFVVTIVAGADLDTAAKLASFDVVVLASPGAACVGSDMDLFDGVIADWVANGGGLIGTGWLLYVGPQPNIGAVMPATGVLYDTGTITAQPNGAHPIGMGVSAFSVATTYTPYGGTPKPGAQTFLSDATGNAIGTAWTYGNGRSAFLGPVYFDGFASYHGAALTDGTTPAAIDLLVNTIQWTARVR